MSASSRGALDGVAAELVAQGGEHTRGVVAVLPRVEAREQGRGEGRHGYVVVDRVLDRPAALAGVRHVAADALEVVALLVERPLGQLAQPRADDRAAVPEARD